MDLKTIVSTMTPETRENLATAIEIGRWSDGSKLTEQQKSSSMQAIIAWDAYYGKETNEPFRVQKGGELNRTVKKDNSKEDSKVDVIKIISTNPNL
ncbi:MAG: YeaC family protein [Gammaproteobacteria bacterium]|nr:YeaC family protein [Gammaproteobacteria bacterium]